MENKLGGTVRLIFQPAEETDGGAKDMIELGALEGVKAIFGLHVEETIKTGIIGVNRNVVSAASNPFKINIKGKGSHGAHPEDGIDSILIAAKVIDNLQSIVSREIAAVDNAVISIGKIHGGTAQNAICSEIVMEGILRTLGKNLREFCIKRMREIVSLTAKMYCGEGTISFIESYPSFENDEKLYKWFMETLEGVNCIKTIELKKPSMGVEDFAYYTEKVPGLYYKLGCRNEEKGITNPAHGSYFDIDEECLLYGCIVQSLSAFKFLQRDISK
ncbi:M20 metallopeptidase family protein [Fervidicella metallireducens]|uniref:M20 metallopeptidase family protein n=1 Tax=Fervidicella metallireducens TaxID=655338 RepID=UPI0024182B76|nr:amidohydrolase [Fervidicella metallireducens]